MFACYLDGYATPARRPAAAAGMVATAARLRASGTSWEALVHAAAAAFPEAGPVEVPVVVFVGMGTSNDWVAPLGGRRTGVPGRGAGPTAAAGSGAGRPSTDARRPRTRGPSVGHRRLPARGAHLQRGPGDLPVDPGRPGRRDGEYLWFDRTHQQWVRDCDRGWPAAADALARVLDDPCGGPAERRFFGLRPAGNHPDIPVRFGYHAGLRLVRELTRTASVTELLAVDVPTAQQLIRDRLGRR